MDKEKSEKFYFYTAEEKLPAKGIELTQSLNITTLVALYYSRFSPRFRFKGEKHNFYELYYVAKGKIITTIEDTQYSMSEGEYIVLPKMAWHAMNPDKCYATGISVSFTGENLPASVLRGTCSPTEKQFLQMFLNTYLKNYKPSNPKNNIQPRSTSQSFACNQMLKCILESFLISAIDNDIQNKADAKMKSANQDLMSETNNGLANAIKQYLEEHVDENISLNELASTMGYSVTHLCRIFKTYFGDSVKNYMTKLKIEKAMQKIELDQEPITKISDNLGFDSISYFSKVFKKVTGISPSEYRKFSVNIHLLDTKSLLDDI